ncbi:MAG: hypothetical protein ABSA12_16580 [Verrucomicrobiia bacterium]
MAFDRPGNLLHTANLGSSTIEEFNSSGVGTVFASSGPDNPVSLAFQPVPEPSAWALVAGGLIAVPTVRPPTRLSATKPGVAATKF